MTPGFRPNQERLVWDQADEVASAILRESHVMRFATVGLGAVGWLYGSMEAAIAWSVAMLISTTILVMACKRFRLAGYKAGESASAVRNVYLASLLQAVVSAGHLPMFWSSGNDKANLVLLLIFVASAMMAVSLTAPSRAMLITKIVFHTALCEVMLVSEGGPTFGVLAMLAPLYFGALASTGVRTYQRSRDVLTLAQEREAMIEDLRRANDAKTRFLANMSHELRTPLNAILGFSELMKTEAFGAHGSAKYREYAFDINASGAHLLDLINDLLDCARVDAGNYAPADETFALGQLFAECTRLLSGRAAEKSLSLKSTRAAMMTLMADRRGIKQVVINLLANAVKFTPAGGHVALDAAREANGGLLISVSDNGPGIEAGDLARIFESFGQGRHDVAERDRGVGLGLAIVKGIVSAHGGSIEVRSKIGEGTAMLVRLPASRVVAPGAIVRAA